MNIDCNINEADIDFAKHQLNAYLKELKTSSCIKVVGPDTKLVDLIMINSCFMAVDIVANYGFRSFTAFFQSLIEKQKKLIESKI